MNELATAITAWEALFRAQVAVMRRLGSDFPIDDVSFNEYDVLFTLSGQPGRRLRLRELNREVLLTQPSVSRLIDRLTARGLVAKEPDPTDARSVVVVLTDTGFSFFSRAAVTHMRSINERVGGALNPDELRTLTALCEKLRFATEQHAA